MPSNEQRSAEALEKIAAALHHLVHKDDPPPKLKLPKAEEWAKPKASKGQDWPEK